MGDNTSEDYIDSRAASRDRLDTRSRFLQCAVQRDSDYDVRFLYVRDRDWYLSVENPRDVIERPIADDLDVSGWDLRKALRLLRKSNPPLLEWLSGLHKLPGEVADGAREGPVSRFRNGS